MTQASSRHSVVTANTPATSPRALGAQAVLARPNPPGDQPPEPRRREFWVGRLRDALAARSSQAFDVAEEGLRAWPADPEILMLAALTALAGNQPERALALLKRHGKRYVPGKAVTLLTALALGQQGHFAQAADNAAWCAAEY